MKKLLLTLGAIASVAAPVAAVIACSDDTKPAGPTANPAQAANAAAKALKAQEDADIAIIKGGVDVNDDKASYIRQVEAASTLEGLKIIFDGLHVRLKDANSYENTHATLPKENTEQFAGQAITWSTDVDVTTLKDGMILEINDGIKQLVEVVEGKWTGTTVDDMKFDGTFDGLTLKTIDGSYMTLGVIGVISKGKTQIAYTKVNDDYVVAMDMGRPDLAGNPTKSGYSIDVTRMGSVK